MDKFKKYISKRKGKVVAIICITIMCFYIIQTYPQNLKISFLDVGQGDAILVTTPTHKTILIDGGGSTDSEKYDVGRRILLPYLLNHHIKKIDLIMISHFDADHVRTDC